MSEAREVSPVTFFGKDDPRPGMVDFKPSITEPQRPALTDLPEPSADELESIEQSGISRPEDDAQLALDLEFAAKEAAVAPAEPVVTEQADGGEKGKVPPA